MKCSRWFAGLVFTVILLILTRLAYPALVAWAGEDELQGAWERARAVSSPHNKLTNLAVFTIVTLAFVTILG